jgi:hypothetical protein
MRVLYSEERVSLNGTDVSVEENTRSRGDAAVIVVKKRGKRRRGRV